MRVGKRLGTIAVVLGMLTAAPGCADAPEAGLESLPVDGDYGKPVLPVELEVGKGDTWDGSAGPQLSGLRPETEVWKAPRRWYEVDPAEGLAWGRDSGLTWDEKYAAWVAGLPRVTAANGSTTFLLRTPDGRDFQAPTLECAETAMFLRATFASWHGLPFYLSAYSQTHGRIHFGHFGIVKDSGAPLAGYPKFATAYRDESATATAEAWPTDPALAKRSLTTLRDDANPFLGEGAYAGAYFDAIFANKRVGHFLVTLLTHFGSMHLADSRNTFNLAPEAMRGGDVLLERWQRQGIGHTLVVKQVSQVSGSPLQLEAETVFGSMPRIQPMWYDTRLSKSYFTSRTAGGEGTNDAGEAYAALGGGLKRWRTPVVKGGRWYTIVPVKDRAAFVNASDLTAIAARPARLEALLGVPTPEELRETLLAQIGEARRKLEERPASCTSRQRREEAFAKLYTLGAEHFGKSREALDAEHRTLADYVLAELDYERSKTCCWNSSTAAMFEIVMAYNTARMEDAESGTCEMPVVFKASGGGYEAFRAYAESIGRGAEWKAWSEDEPCAQRAVVEDTEVAHGWTPWCSVAEAVLGGGGGTGGGCGDITWEGRCEGTNVVWCENGALERYECPAGTACGWSADLAYWWCL